MLINPFFKLKFYTLGLGWTYLKFTINQALFASYVDQKLIFYDYNFMNIKKSFVFIQNIVKNLGIIMFFTSSYTFTKVLSNLNFSMQEFILKNYKRGCLSNYFSIYNLKIIPDLIITLSNKENTTFFYEIRTIGIPIINLSHSLNLINCNEYSVYINTNSYFVNYIILQLYAKFILLQRKYV